MVYKKLSEEDKIIFKYLRQKFCYGAKRIIKDHPEKNWGLRNVGYLLKKIDETGDVKRRKGSGRSKSSRTENNINAVKGLISSQEDKPGTHATPNEILKMMNIPRTLIRRIITEDLKLQPFKKIKGQRIDTRTKEKRIEPCPNLLRVFTKQVLETAFFSCPVPGSIFQQPFTFLDFPDGLQLCQVTLFDFSFQYISLFLHLC